MVRTILSCTTISYVRHLSEKLTRRKEHAQTLELDRSRGMYFASITARSVLQELSSDDSMNDDGRNSDRWIQFLETEQFKVIRLYVNTVYVKYVIFVITATAVQKCRCRRIAAVCVSLSLEGEDLNE
jgi:hypothetical protein